MENGTATQGEGRDPSGFLSEIIGSQVTVKLNSGVVYKGELQSVDGYMNIALEKTEEHVNGVKKRSYGDAFVRGNNGVRISKENSLEGDLGKTGSGDGVTDILRQTA
ncbi:putative U6 snRNA-associated Sm-like protein LSm6 [Glarea lozoyensis 74030]|uniref:U6 snRNA-associated Sm-like protein LSm6 n=1 Tax=Glarea lozoyensis (strain ATCC 74030 / MF5533) TaxID=1104152 RepID=H0EDS7_GLAL7|nr:putative U6 snRNA-associated Sm-like protein LSm6 [Glarea lozoyensis 74030]